MLSYTLLSKLALCAACDEVAVLSYSFPASSSSNSMPLWVCKVNHMPRAYERQRLKVQVSTNMQEHHLKVQRMCYTVRLHT